MATLSLMAGSNALYFQKSRHPAPLFWSAPAEPVASREAAPEPARTAAPAKLPALPAIAPVQEVPAATAIATNETTASLPATAADGEPSGNADVFEVQKKLQEMKLFEGKVDGYYGPMTARAIRAFELSAGMKPLGAMTPEVVEAIRRAPVYNPAVAREPEVLPTRQSETIVQAMAEPATARMPAAPQHAASAAAPVAPQETGGAEAVLDAAGESAAETLDSIVAALQDAAEPALERRVAPPSATALAPPAEVAAPKAAAKDPAKRVPSTDPQLVAKVQRGLASLGFLAGSVDGVPGEATAKAIRNFEVYYNYDVTGQVTPELVDMLVSAGAVI